MPRAASCRLRNRSRFARSSLPRRRFLLEPLEERLLLSITAGSDGTDVLPGDVSSADAGAKSPLQAEFVVGELLVGFEGEVAEAFRGRGAEAALAAAGKIVGPFGLSGGRVLMNLPAAAGRAARLTTHWQLAPGADVLDAVARLSGKPGIAYAEPNWIHHAALTPNDPQFPDLWGLHNTGQTGGTADADIDAPEAWNITTGSNTVIVGIIDTGTDYNHEDLAANMWVNPGEIAGNGIDDDGNGYVDDVYGANTINGSGDPMDDHGHGTHTAGTVGAVGDNGVGVAGVNWNVRIAACKFLDAGGSGTTEDAIECFQYFNDLKAVRGQNVVVTNNSWGGGGFSQALQDAMEGLDQPGMAPILHVAAAGNAASDNDAFPHYPSSYPLPNLIAVAATDHNDDRAGFSSYGATSVDLGAPGVDVLSTLPGDSYGYFSGTSMATPHVAGVAALAFGILGGGDYTIVRDAIFAGVDPLPSMAGITLTGGRLNAFNTLQQVGMTVTGSDPAGGEVIFDQRQDFVVDFSFDVAPATLQAADLEISLGGTTLTPNSVLLLAPNQAQFHFNTSPIATIGSQGEYTMHMAAGAVATSSTVPPDPLLKAWTAHFRYDATLMQVVSTNPPSTDPPTGVMLPLTSLTVNFNEAYDPDTLGTDDVMPSQGTVVDADIVDANSVVYTLAGIDEEGTLTIAMAAGALTDVFGNPMAAFSASYALDFGTVPYPVPLGPKSPQGSLIYDPTVSGIIGVVGDTDSFTINVDPGQTITVVVRPDSPGLAPTVQLSGPGGVIASDSAAAGEDALIQTAATTSASTETYTVTVGGGSTIGAFTVQLILNAAVELEANDSIGAAQDINASFIPLSGTAERGAVMGGIEDDGCLGPDGFGYKACVVETPVFDDISATGTLITQLQNTDDGSQVLKKGGKPSGFSFDFYGTAVTEKNVYASSNGLLTIDAGNNAPGNGDLGSFPDQATIAPFWDDLVVDGAGGVYWQVKGSGDDQYLVVQWDQVRFFGGPAGNPITFQVVLRENFGNPYIQFNYADLTSGAFGDEGASATAGVKAAGAQGTNRLLVSLNNGPNQYVGTGRSTRIGVDLPSIVTTADYYAFDLAANERATVVLHTSGGSASVELQNASGTSVGTVVSPNPSNVAMAIDFAGGAAGTYYAVVTGDSQAQYRALVIRGGTFDFEKNSGPEPWNGDEVQTVALNGNALVLGSIGGGIGGGATVGYYTDGNPGSIGPEAPLLQAGFTPIQITNITSFNLDTIDVLMVNEWDNSGLSSAMLGRLSDIETWVENGGAFIVHDRFVSSGLAEPNPFVIGAPGVLVQRDFAFDADLNVIPPGGTLVTDGPFGVIDDSSLDGGTSSSHGFADATTFPAGAVSILSAGPDTNHVAAFSYPLLGGAVYYSTIPLDYYLDGNGPSPPRENLNTIYTPNALVYLHGLLVPEVDFFAFTVAGGVEGTLDLHTSTPAGGPGEFVNHLDPMLRLYDASGIQLAADDNGDADGRNAHLAYPIPFSASPRTFYVSVMASDLTVDPTRGEYVLAAQIGSGAPVNNAPTAVDDAFDVLEGGSLSVAAPGLLGNDGDVDGDALTAVLVSGPSTGTLDFNADGSFMYTPDPGFVGTDSFTYMANDGSLDSNVATVSLDVDVAGSLRTGMVAVGSDAWTTVTLDHDYGTGMVVVATANYDGSSAPLVVRIQNAADDSFEVRVGRADGLATAVTGVDVYYTVVAQGVYTLAEHGVTLEAVKFTSTLTDAKGSWTGQTRSYSNTYANPVVVGQVMTYNDADYSVFWAGGATAQDPPSAAALRVGKHVGEDSDTTRANETIGYLVIEAGAGAFGSLAYVAGVGAEVVRGFDNAPPFSYALSGLSSASSAAVSLAGMNGGDGGWAVLYGPGAIAADSLNLAVDEDQISDLERGHTTEQAAYLVFGSVDVGVTVPLETGTASGVSNAGWTTVTLGESYTSMVVVASANYDNASVPLVVRIQNAAADSFEVRVDRADGLTDPVSGVVVHYTVVEEGVYTSAVHGVTLEAFKFTSTLTDAKGSWTGQTRSYSNTYTNPVVVGQVMSYNDPDFSAFWAGGATAQDPPSAAALRVGKHVGEDSDTTRTNETIGYIVIEAGAGTFGSLAYVAGVGAEIVRGFDNAPPFTYALSGLDSASSAAVSLAGMNGGDGGWAVLYGPGAVAADSLNLAVDEDRISDSERGHTFEQIAYLVFGTAGISAALGAPVGSQPPLAPPWQGGLGGVENDPAAASSPQSAAVDAALAAVLEGELVGAENPLLPPLGKGGLGEYAAEVASDEQPDRPGAAAVTSSPGGLAVSSRPAPSLLAPADNSLAALVDLALADLDGDDALLGDLVADGVE